MAAQSEDLRPYVDGGSTYCLNEDPAHPHANVFADDDRVLQSADDEQLLLYIPFTEKVNIQSIAFRGESGESAPALVKLFVNRPSMSFDDAEDAATQVLELTDKDLADGATTALRVARFQRVSSLTVFVEENRGADETRLRHLAVYGSKASMLLNVTELQNCKS